MRASDSITKALGVADKGELQILYDGKTIEKGAHVGRADAESAPELVFTAANPSKTYIVICVDLDAPFPSFSPMGPILHWIQSGLRPEGQKLKSDSPFIADYVGPAPPPPSAPHRYVFIVYEQPATFVEKDHASPEGKKVGMWPRVRWSLDEFEKKAGLSAPLAATVVMNRKSVNRLDIACSLDSEMEDGTRSVEVLVVGAGIGGLSAAKTYLELSPQADLLIVDQRRTVGGVWALENCYEGLKTNNLCGTYEWPDYPLDAKKYGFREDGHIPGLAFHHYMTDFAKHFDLHRRIEFRTRIQEVEKLADCRWKVRTERTDPDDSTSVQILVCEKLIVASGLASKPNPINLPNIERFDRPIMNQGRLRTDGQKAADDPDVKSATVIGASKSGYDAVFLMASHGKKVDWIIRKSGGGATSMSPPWIPLPGRGLQMIEHAATMRYYSWFSPCVWGNFDGFGWIRGFLHGTRLGRWLTHNFWEKIRMDGVNGNGYRREKKLKHLEPDEGLFWTARVGIHNYATEDGSVHEFVRSGQVRIIKDDIVGLSSNGTVELAGGSKIQTDCLVQTTGWSLEPSIKYSPAGLAAKIGVPHAIEDEKERLLWRGLDDKAEQEILRRFPALQNPPKKVLTYKSGASPLRMYRGMAPPGLTAEGDRSIVFIKFVHSTSNFILAEVQSLWAYAYLNRKLEIDQDRVYWDTALTSRYGKVRYPCGFSHEFIWDVIPYADMLLTDLGLRRWRKKTWKAEIFDGYVIQDYQGINQEWKQLHSGKG